MKVYIKNTNKETISMKQYQRMMYIHRTAVSQNHVVVGKHVFFIPYHVH